MADRINELEKQYTNQSQNTKNQRYTYLDPTKTTRVPNTALKAFQKNAVQSYFERQQQQHHSPTPKDVALSNRNQSASPSHAARPQSLPLPKTTNQLQMIAQSRSSLPTKLSQTLHIGGGQPAQQPNPSADEALLTGCLGLGVLATRNSTAPLSPTQTSPMYHQAIFSSVVQPESPMQKLHHGILDSRIMTIEQSNLQAANESGVPPPPPRRPKQSMPVRRYVGRRIQFNYMANELSFLN